MSSSPESFVDADQVAVERAISEIRSNRPVLVQEEDTLLVFPAETLDEERAVFLSRFSENRPQRQAHLLLTAPRLHRLGLERSTAGSITLPHIDRERITTLALVPGVRIDAPVTKTTPLEDSVLELARLALVLPSMVVIPVEEGPYTALFHKVSASSLRVYRSNQARQMSVISRALVPLEDAPRTEFVVFRGGEGLRDQVAILISQPDISQPVTVRLHSACLTGDLFGSLRCDCGDQLRTSVRTMAQDGGGILLYLDQEGRGNGLSNKIRAYQLQAKGWDTYEADEVFGLPFDQRRFDFAANMLTLLGVSQVRLMTNNPIKIQALQETGLTVVSEHRIFGREQSENIHYLAAKRDKAGHAIDLDPNYACTGVE
jgi:GTP cyclohydrolase II